jgi:hypothetical protein
MAFISGATNRAGNNTFGGCQWSLPSQHINVIFFLLIRLLVNRQCQFFLGKSPMNNLSIVSEKKLASNVGRADCCVGQNHGLDRLGIDLVKLESVQWNRGETSATAR